VNVSSISPSLAPKSVQDAPTTRADSNYALNHPVISDLHALKAAFDAGDQAAMRSVLSRFKGLQDPRRSERGPNFAANHPIINDLETLQAAARSGDKTAMKSDFAKLMSDIEAAQTRSGDPRRVAHGPRPSTGAGDPIGAAPALEVGDPVLRVGGSAIDFQA
jgi:hypothetical protein